MITHILFFRYTGAGRPIYGTRDIGVISSASVHALPATLGRPKTITDGSQEALRQEQAKRCEECLQRIPIKGKFGQGKNGYRLNYIRAKRADTSFAWIDSIFLVMNLLILLRIFFALCKTGFVLATLVLTQIKKAFCESWKARQLDDFLCYTMVTA